MFRLAANVVIAGSVWVLAACAGEEFTFAPPDGSGTIDAHSPEPRDASMESPEETRVDALPERFSDEASVDATLDSPPNDAMMWTPDAIEEPPPKCGAAGFVCAPAVPPGWSGPLELYSGSDAPGTRCGAHFQGPVYDGNNVLSAQVAMCDCQCQMPQAVQCSPLAASFFAGIGGTCTAVEHCGDRMLTGACQPIDVRANCVVMGMQGASMSVPAPTASGGSCMPAVTKTLPPPSWKVGGRACVSALGSAPGSCEPGYVCAPQPGAPFEASLCIAQAGDVPCQGGYTARRLFYGGILDTRDCSPCTCGDVAGATCSASVDVFRVAGPMTAPCSGLPTTYLTPASCDPVDQPADFRLKVQASGGSCKPTPVTAVGNVAAAQPTTFCCWP